MNYLQEVKDKLREKDQADIIDLLGITSEDLVERFDDLIEENLHELIESELGETLLDPFYDEDPSD